MTTAPTLAAILEAREARDPELPRMIAALASERDGRPRDLPENTRHYADWHREVRLAWNFRQLSDEEQEHRRVQGMRDLEANDDKVPMPDRLKLWTVIMDLWRHNGAWERACLLEVIATVPLCWGPWRALKRIFKESERRGDMEIYGALVARFDVAASHHYGSDVTRATLAYLRRRGWRTLRRLGQTLPAVYVDACVEVLRAYRIDSPHEWRQTWVAAHIWYHELGYTRGKVRIPYRLPDMLKHRAFAELWKRTPRPLFTLLERARAEPVREYAVKALKANFRAALREVEATWVCRLIHVRSATIDEFVVWLLGSVPKFEEAAFRELGLHDAVLSLLDSASGTAAERAAAYARTHARELPVDRLIELIDSDHKAVRKLAKDLLRDRDPRKDVGLEAWGRVLDSGHGHKLAVEVLRKHFGKRELTAEWLRERLLSSNPQVFEFARDRLPELYKIKDLGPAFFAELHEDPRHEQDANWKLKDTVFGWLEKFPVEELDIDVLRRGLLHTARSQVLGWIQSGRLKPRALGVGFLKAMIAPEDRKTEPFFKALPESGFEWARDFEVDGWCISMAIQWLSDVREFTPTDLGFDWLMALAESSDETLHSFAVETMIKVFIPADFAAGGAEPEEPEPSGEINVDLDGQTFVFTGKLATMSRSEAQKKVTAANGKNSKSVNNKLHYLVIGDEGSPLYGQGRKGSKQTKAEKLIDDGAELKIISETAFLQMLAGQVREASGEEAIEGATRLWELATAEAESPLARFALRYIRMHHPDIALAATDRPVDPGAEVSEDFLTFERVRPLYRHPRPELRRFALELSRWEFARWQPALEDLAELCESADTELFRFLSSALLSEDDSDPQLKRFRVDPARVTASAAWRFCESNDRATRGIGMALIDRDPKLADPTSLYRLFESPDRRLRAFVVRRLWSIYRDRGLTEGWSPPPMPEPKDRRRRSAEAELDKLESRGVPTRPEEPPASHDVLLGMLRQSLFTLAPARLPKGSARDQAVALTPLPTRKAKLALIETLRDLACEDADFAALVLPLLDEFKGSRGKSEHAACLVAVTRIRKAHPGLAVEV